MANAIVLGATVFAAVLGLAAFVTLAMEQFVASGTLFVLTSFAIYIRETRG